MEESTGTESHPDSRKFIRHTVDVPIEVRPVDAPRAAGARGNGPAGAGASSEEAHSLNLGVGGLSFASEYCPDIGDVVEIRIDAVEPVFVASARVAWCRPENGRNLVGVAFLDERDAFRSRMVQQVCAIQAYRKEVLEEEGRELTTEQASAEWIAKYAGRFPS